MKRSSTWPRAPLVLLSSCALLSIAAACGPERADVELGEMSRGFALPIDCAAEPADLQAEAWVSGFRESTPLDVDLAAGTTSGELRDITVGDRRLVIDWFVERDFGGSTVRIMLAQAETALDLTAPETNTVSVEIGPDDVEVAACRDVRGDSTLAGSDTVSFDGADRPVCDLDDSCAGTPGPECANLGELCAGDDPLAL